MHDKSSVEKSAQTNNISSAASVVGQLANFVIAVEADSFFESGTTASEALCTTKAQLKRALRLTIYRRQRR